mmetsp:Transcript_17517/g.24946  ORF Transcript_17517/g.24946 Transcript_17517/m.24946 type:complete len:643 (-) Transcript_17517:1395-3323(-)|eukprot:CAMPEP_0172419834 /NCGR_PEP_ID=MMETSP1064-20121228/6224_1 /TAXON_ID=202472 /ORGANISM="Aulacoseira subarctica , Strain CCAP 1002/5" /LENGTH=642 /DNA_ID=CAMNT_0013159493 /DNA_START=103 /DNA_END=2031 /DNA_ORIENTATION=+
MIVSSSSYYYYLILLSCSAAAASAFSFLPSTTAGSSASTRLSMVLQADPATAKKLQKVEALKIKSDYLRHPLKEELVNDEIFVTKDGYNILKYHGSYQQTNREVKGAVKDYQFMLRLKQPAGELPPDLFRLLDDLSAKYGQGDLRATTRQCFQVHGILKGGLKTVISSLMNIGSSTVGACGDVSRNVMCTPAPFQTPEYKAAREWSKVIAQLFKPMSPAFTEIWLDGEKAASVEMWNKDIESHNVPAKMVYDNGRGIVLPDKTEPLYGTQYLPRKFKVVFTVPGDNSVDIYTNDIGCVVICNQQTGELEGFNVMVGGGMGRTHNKENTFPRAADHLGFAPKEQATELFKAILAAQRDHGDREVRATARMKYLVHSLGIDNFRKLVESYCGFAIQPYRPMKEWKYMDWMGWWDQGDGNLFLGLHVDNGRVKDEGNFRLKTALRVLVDKFNLHMVLSPTQSILFKDVDPKIRPEVDAILKEHGILPIEEVDPLARLAMSCPALPLCGLAQTEAERRMPSYIERIRVLLNKMNIGDEEIMIRMTGCPNGCARPYMAELAFVGDGSNSYQVWLGGSPVMAERTAFPYMAKMDTDAVEVVLEPILAFFIEKRQKYEAFGDFCHRMGIDAIQAYSNTYFQTSPMTAKA